MNNTFLFRIHELLTLNIELLNSLIYIVVGLIPNRRSTELIKYRIYFVLFGIVIQFML